MRRATKIFFNWAWLSLLICCPVLGKSASNPIFYQQVGSAQGLISEKVNDIKKDEDGFLWFAHASGLSRFDGKNILNYQESKSDSQEISLGEIRAIETYGQEIIVSREDGIYKWDAANSNIEKIGVSNWNPDYLLRHKEILYAAATKEGIRVLNLENQDLLLDIPYSKSGEVYNVFKDNLGLVWIASEKGLWISRSNNSLQKIPGTENLKIRSVSQTENEYWAVSHEHIYQITASLQPKVYSIPNRSLSLYSFESIVCYKNSLILSSNKSGFWEVNISQKSLSKCVSENDVLDDAGSIHCHYLDESGQYFFGSAENGVYSFNVKALSTAFEEYRANKRISLKPIAVSNSKENLTVLNERSIFILDWNGLVQNSTDLSFLETEVPRDISVDSAFYYVLNKEKLYLLNKSFDLVQTVSFELERNEDLLAIEKLGNKLFVLSENKLWSYEPHTSFKQIIKQDIDGSFLHQEGGSLLLVADDGIRRIEENGQIALLSIKGFDNKEYRKVTAIAVAANGLWLGCSEQGIFYAENASNNALVVQESFSETLSNLSIRSLQLDAAGSLWVGTRHGLNRLLIDNNQVLKYYENDGLLSSSFSPIAIQHNKSLFFGTSRGIIQFNPSDVDRNFNPPNLVFSGFDVNNVSRLGASELQDIKKIELEYEDRVFTVAFSALDYQNPEEVKYWYKLEGLSNDWIYLNNESKVTFSNLNKGSYQFEVRAESGNGLKVSEPISLSFEITPPFYASLWFKLLLGFIVALFIGGAYLLRIQQEKLRNEMLEKEVAKRTLRLQEQNRELAKAKEKAQESDKAKSEFMATMSHEIRTPMNGIMGSVSILDGSELSQEQKDHINIISESGENMLAIINEILDYSKIETGRLEPNISEFDLHKQLRESIDVYANRAYKKGLVLACHLDKNVPAKIKTDKARLTQILGNLLSNAVKFTTKGHVLVEVKKLRKEEGGSCLEFRVSDTGRGISAKKQDMIWEAFTQVDSTSKREFGGTGLGLAICKNMVNLLGGKIHVESEEGAGATFTVELPVEFEGEGIVIPKFKDKKLLIATASSLVNNILDRYAEECEMTYQSIHSYEDLGSIDDSMKYDVCIIDEKGASYEAGEAFRKMSKKTVLLHSQDNEEKGYDFKLKYPVWRKDFWKLFEANTGDKTASSKEHTKLSEDAAALSVLLAEDNKVNQMVTKRIFARLGVDLDIAVNGREAVDLYAQKRHNVVLMDLLMPEMDGNEATNELRETYGENGPFIVAFSANIYNQDKGHLLKQGFNFVLGKPAKLENVVELLESVATEAVSS